MAEALEKTAGFIHVHAGQGSRKVASSGRQACKIETRERR